MNPSKINYSRMVEDIKNQNPEEEDIFPSINFRDVEIPKLPPHPTQ